MNAPCAYFRNGRHCGRTPTRRYTTGHLCANCAPDHPPSQPIIPNGAAHMDVDTLEDQLADELTTAIVDYSNNRPRTLQKTIGPSEIGEPCQRKLAYKLLDWPKVNTGGDPLPSFVGTAAHTAMETALERVNQARPGTWIVEKRVHASDTMSGSTDAYHCPTDTVVDHKFPGVSSMRKYKADGPSPIYRVQAHVYGLGWERGGYWPKHVAIAFYPRGGNLKNLHMWSEPYDRQVAMDALARLETIRAAVTALDPEQAPDRWALFPTSASHACTFCPWWKAGSTYLGDGCPSEPGAVYPRKDPEELIA